MNPVEVGDLRNAIIHTLKKPFIRVNGINFESVKGERNTFKKAVKRISGDLERMIHSSKYMEVSDELSETVGGLMSKGNIRQFWNSFYNARPPFERTWIEFDRAKLLCGMALNTPQEVAVRENQLIAPLGVYITKTSSYSFMQAGGISKELKSRLSDCKDDLYVYNFFGSTSYVSKHDGQRKQDSVYHFPFGLVSSAFTDANFAGVEERQSRVNEQYLDLLLGEWDTNKIDHLFGDGKFSSDYKNVADNLLVTNGSINIRGGAESYQHSEPERELMSDLAGIVPMVTAILSMLNYPWTTQENYSPHNNVKSITNKMTPYDSHIRVSINLPKEKVINLTMKQKERTRPFGVREHDVMGHRRTWIDKHGERRETWVKPHTRGDSKLGRVYKDYVLDKDGKKRVANSR